MAAIVIAALVVVALVVWQVRRRRRESAGASDRSGQLVILRTWAGVLLGFALLPNAQASMLP